MIAVTINLENFDGWREALQRFPEEAPQAIDRAIGYAADAVAVIAQNMPPVSARESGWGAIGFPVAPNSGGTMRQNTHGVKTGFMMAEVIADTNYSIYVEQGTPSFELNRSVFIPGVGWRFIKTHPGAPARPFFDWTLNQYGGMQKVEDIVQDTIDKLLAV